MAQFEIGANIHSLRPQNRSQICSLRADGHIAVQPARRVTTSRILPEAEVRQDEANNDDRSDDVNDTVHNHSPVGIDPTYIHDPLKGANSPFVAAHEISIAGPRDWATASERWHRRQRMP